ncbi:hypothetical protein T265_09184 [Opisthorchis viverrini]|uniref:Reverse transcriptase domain-containing protein n=1 Tax=Opisthorchis viverrini TaxID=6198 RepID=A0A074Z6S5_OPIVI|nr:hypothetical protein T265_09184 [Opisthorchis viverrini]KER22778.1 hypothetical protein T265_09184 [Opisthorchis viverrini]
MRADERGFQSPHICKEVQHFDVEVFISAAGGLQENTLCFSPGSYRPISLTSKVMERILKRDILDHLTSSNLISPAQHGFLPNRSCVTNMLVFMDSLTQAKDEGLISDAIFFDFSKAFDRDPHVPLLHKHESYGIQGKIHRWIKAFLSDRDCVLSVKNDLTIIKCPLITYQAELLGLSIMSVTCSNLAPTSDDTLSCCFKATRTKRSVDPRNLSINMAQFLVDSDELLCKFCQNTFAKTKEVKSFNALSPTFSLEDNTLMVEESHFCHPKHPDKENQSFHVQLSKPVFNPECVTHSSAAYTGTEVILSPALQEAGCFKEQAGKYIHCSRCLMAVGQKVNVGASDQYALWTNCLDVLTEERDIDGDFLRFVEKPLQDEMDFYGLFISGLIDNQCYRVIISAITWHGCIDFMLLWLIDQELDLYSASLPRLPPSHEQTHEVSGSESSKLEKLKPAEPPTVSLKLEPTACRRVFYRIVLPTEGNTQEQSHTLLKSWRHDFGVTLVCLPWETCIGLATCLQQFTSRIAPQFRVADRHLSGFTLAWVGVGESVTRQLESVFGCVTGTSIEECVQHQKLRWLGHVLRMPNHRLPKRVLVSMRNSEWRKQRGGQPLTWQRSMKEITKRLGAVGATGLPGWGPRDPHCAWLETLQDMAANRSIIASFNAATAKPYGVNYMDG